MAATLERGSTGFQVNIRDIAAADAPGVTVLLKELGYDWEPVEVAERIEGFLEKGERGLVAVGEDAQLLGLLTLHVTHVLHRGGPVGRLTTMVVSESARGQGIGRALVAAGEEYLWKCGCVMIEVTSNKSRGGAHSFYKAVGYDETSLRFAKVRPGGSELRGH